VRALLASLSVALGCSAPAHARDTVVTSFDGTPIVAHFYLAAGLGARERAPTVLVGPGYGKPGNTNPGADVSDAIGAASLRAAGYNVLTWDPRGLGGSGGIVTFDSPDFEARDVQALLDYVALQPEALLDAPGDPRAGMSGFSYGGAIQLVTAAIEPRIDAIVPDGSWHSLPTTFLRDGAVRAGWLAAICAGGEATAAAGGLMAASPELKVGSTATELKRACAEALATGDVSSASRQWLADRGPGELVRRIRAPTLLLQGTDDALFGLDEAIANHALLREAGVPLKMIWYCGGHGTCASQGDPQHVRRAGLAWLKRYLQRDASVDTGAGFEWIVDGVWRSAAAYPLPPGGTLDATGAGTLTISSADTAGAGLVTQTTPALLNAINATFTRPPAAVDVVGPPRLRLSYRGTAVPARTFLYAQVVDATRARVAGLQVTPIPVILDGRARTVQRPLESLALRPGPDSDLRLQITPGTSAYDVQRATGAVHLSRIEASLPVAGAAPPAPAAQVLRTPRRLLIGVSSRRAGAASRIVLRSRLRSKPCTGRVRFEVRAGRARRSVTTRVRSSCAIRAVVRLRVRRGRRARISARFEGNAALAPRRARSRTVTLR
jgi:ABC-2 type transport system ATP-binding protein